MFNKLVILFYVVSNKVWKKMSQRELLHTALCKEKGGYCNLRFDSTKNFIGTLFGNKNELQKT